MSRSSKAGGSLGPGSAVGNEAGATSPAMAKRSGTGRRVSEERGARQRSKKNPGSRPTQGGSSR
ncbi:MAG TPA: hypothetical protein VMU47_10230 [Caldimonas sp.]|nr:hypothetical protein [Caldimonas sp.]